MTYFASFFSSPELSNNHLSSFYKNARCLIDFTIFCTLAVCRTHNMNCVNGQAVHGFPHYILELAYNNYSVAGVPHWYTNLRLWGVHREIRKIWAGLRGSQDLTIILQGIFFKRKFQSGNKKNFLAYSFKGCCSSN